jgi:hypothetical protein
MEEENDEVTTYQIFVVNKVKKEVVEKEKYFTTNRIHLLKEYLMELQKEYCKGEKSECFEIIFKDGNKKKYLALAVKSNSDFIHVAPLRLL